MADCSPTPRTADHSSRQVQVGGRRVHYHEAGTGDAVFLLHGGGPGASGWSNFNRNVASFAAHYRTLVPDFPGFGRSEARDLSGGLFTTMADWLLGMLDALDIDKAHLVGNSMGGGTAIKLALEHPDRVGKIVLMAPGGFLPPFAVMPSEGLKVLFSFYAAPPTRERLLSFLSCMVYDTASLTDELLEQRLEAASNPAMLADPPFKPGAPPPVEELWRDQRLPALDHRFLLLWGRDDRTIPLDSAFTGLKQLKNAELHVFSQCGHWVQWEKAESFNRLVSDFLA
jgi:2-hydroxy-6-oxonona-2,4-dienedioate hydrolase/4,5:9,10-diseco-3-hydroxy-5,9,17-trioxoandrosta-1(10),2-diene-4-oate hydrolase